jgi:hypothetical protein
MTFMRTSKSKWALAAAIVLRLASQTQAATTDNLQHLADTNSSLTIGDKTFSDFEFLASGLTSFDASQIQVTASVANGIYYLTWAGNISLVSGSGPITADLILNYRVTAATGMLDILTSHIPAVHSQLAEPSSRLTKPSEIQMATLSRTAIWMVMI